MIRFINIGEQIDDKNRFAFYDTVTDKFCEFSGSHSWDNISDFEKDFQGDDIDRYKRLINHNWRIVIDDFEDEIRNSDSHFAFNLFLQSTTLNSKKMNKNRIPAEKDIQTSITLENEFSYDVLMDIELTSGGDFYLKIIFPNTSLKDIELLNDLFQKPKALDISSPFFDKEGYDITQIVLEQISIPGTGSVILEGLSDKPFDLEYKR